MKIFLITMIFFISFSQPLIARETLVLSVVENTPSAVAIIEILRTAYNRLDIDLIIEEYPAERGLYYSNNGITDGEVFRTRFIEEEYPNLIRVDVALQTDGMYMYVKDGVEIEIEGMESIPEDFIVGFRRGVKFIEFFSSELNLKTMAVDNVEQLFLLLRYERVDGIITGEPIGQRMIINLNMKNIVRLESPIYTSRLYHYLHVSHSDLVPELTAVLKDMQVRGELNGAQ